MGTIEADYLVIGAGATAMAFVDTLVSETSASVVVVDRNHRPGGHWTTAYPFVRLHQPSAYYGVNSRPLGNDTIDGTGLNKGFYELAAGADVCAYFDEVMQQQLLPTGRVTYFPMSEYLGDGRIGTPGGDTSTSPHTGGSSTRRSWVSPCRRCGPRRTTSHPGSTACRRMTCPPQALAMTTSSSARVRPPWTPACGCCDTASSRSG